MSDSGEGGRGRVRGRGTFNGARAKDGWSRGQDQRNYAEKYRRGVSVGPNARYYSDDARISDQHFQREYNSGHTRLPHPPLLGPRPFYLGDGGAGQYYYNGHHGAGYFPPNGDQGSGQYNSSGGSGARNYPPRSRGDRRGKGGSSHRGGRAPNSRSHSTYRQQPNEREVVREARHYLTGYKKLQEWLKEPADIVVHSLLCDRSGLKQLLEEEDVREDKMFLLIKLLALAVTCDSSHQGVHDIFTMVFTHQFVSKLVNFQISLTLSNSSDVKYFLEDQHRLLNAYCRAMPFDALDKVLTLITSVKMVLSTLMQKRDDLETLIVKYEDMDKMFESYAIRKTAKADGKLSFADKLAALDTLERTENFRELSVEPTADDICVKFGPVIRRNIINGQYKDVENYLDIQFRLLREDFVRPLRDGISAYKENNSNRNAAVRIYRNVMCLGSEIIRGKLIFSMKLNMPNKFRLETSKRLMFGNLICLSSNGFQTFALAHVTHKDEAKLRNGIIGISFFSDVKIALDVKYTLVESRTFYTAYKHVLSALQKMNMENFPLTEHIVHVQKNVQPPLYLLDNNGLSHHKQYDLRTVMKFSYMKLTEPSHLFPQSPSRPPGEDKYPLLRSLDTGLDLTFWPSCEEFRLDPSQLAALHSALTKRMVIIQGPPGTGKTFLGLKITQILLHNSEAWNNSDKTPILVVCYTNHALDQFLEGMQQFTNRILRIGSRSKSEAIQRYQINSVVSELKKARKIPAILYQANLDMTDKFMDAETKYKQIRARMEKITNAVGILKWKVLKSFKVIPEDVAKQLGPNGQDYRAWLLKNHVNSWMALPSDQVWEKPARVMQDLSDDKEDDLPKNDEEWQDALEFLREEEAERMNDDDYDDFHSGVTSQATSNDDDFEILMDDYDREKRKLMLALSSQKISEFECNMEMDRIKEESESLVRLLNFCKKDVSQLKLKKDVDIRWLDIKDKGLLYALWEYQVKAKLHEKLHPFEVQFRQLCARESELKLSRYLHVARQAYVVGMTTTGAAEYQAMIQDLKPKIVIVEEAAEILEAHVVASLSSNCQHLIMIGDHQQLKPSTAVYELATRYGLETSMFERLIKNGLDYQTLEYQHRMRPEISRLLVPAIYPKLKDHQSVNNRPPVRGVSSSVFFIAHQHKELKESDDNNSHSNPHEAELIIQLARHLVLQGYSSENITVLTPYSGQFFLLRQEHRKFSNVLNGLRISIVDNFQGEENDIILLSLVRSNDSGNVGFLKIENRVCVSLSRAKLGMFITGNMEQLCAKAPLWQKINDSLKQSGSVGEALTLCCQNHPDQQSLVKTAEDIRKCSPDGGCRKACSCTLPLCGHNCPRICHIDDPAHENSKCMLPCEKKCPKRSHPCKELCWRDCPPCIIKVEKKLMCDHTHSIECHIDREKFKCPTSVEKTIPACKHTIPMPCHQDPAKFCCPLPCEVRLDCGHACKHKCHVNNDPEHKNYLCHSPCALFNKNCSNNHKCQLRCFDKCLDCKMQVSKRAPCGHTHNVKCSTDMTDFKCTNKCKKMLPCGHHCALKCFEDCGDCKVVVDKTITECGHSVKVACGTPATRSHCSVAVCLRPLPCGHKCSARCAEPCTARCMEPVQTLYTCHRGHTVRAPCHLVPTLTADTAPAACLSECGTTLECDHRCGGLCGTCLHGRLHQPCTQPCTRVLVCGHVCKSPCSAACPPCQERCRWKCAHSRCTKNCGLDCVPCKELCLPRCQHQDRCNKRCGEPCPCESCPLPCNKKLPCGHACVGLCGDPCPPLCRLCNEEELTEMLFGEEDNPDARFVLLPDCGHVVEHDGLSGWLMQESKEVQMKRCPKCQQPIYNSVRFKKIILETYADVRKVLFQHGQQRTPQLKEISPTVQGMLTVGTPRTPFLHHIKSSRLAKAVAEYVAARRPVKMEAVFGRTGKVKGKVPRFSEEKLHLFSFQAAVLQRATEVWREVTDEDLRQDLDALVARVMAQEVRVVKQFASEVECELQRILTLPLVRKARIHAFSQEVSSRLATVDRLMSPVTVFTKEVDRKVRQLLRECEKFAGSLGVSDEERRQIVAAMYDVQSGAWYKCPNGHIYCIGNCGGAMVTATCPECKAIIGGTNHRLLNGNTHAQEMDGSHGPAWPL